jgi:glycine cleavage system H protein
MSEIPSDLRYAQSHEWCRLEDDGSVTVGISDHAQEQLGDLVFVEVPEVGTHLDAGDAFAVVESVKAASDVYSPIAGEVVAVNEALADAPESVNSDPYGEGWLMRLQPDDSTRIEELLDASAYDAVVQGEG